MRNSVNNSVARILLVLICAVFPLHAQAYVDPGAGVLLWQGLIAFLGVLIFFLRNPLQAMKAVFRRLFGKKPEERE